MYNYRFFVEQLEEQFLSCGRECLTLMYIDVDDFKLYNQLYGVGEGDAALCRIGEVISRCTGESGIVFRTSGKVFAVLLPLQDTQLSLIHIFLIRWLKLRSELVLESGSQVKWMSSSKSEGISPVA